jgi:hypothetical protein
MQTDWFPDLFLAGYCVVWRFPCGLLALMERRFEDARLDFLYSIIGIQCLLSKSP